MGGYLRLFVCVLDIDYQLKANSHIINQINIVYRIVV